MATVTKAPMLTGRVNTQKATTRGDHVKVDLLVKHVYLANESCRNDMWFMDMRVSNHMTSHRSVFAELDTSVTGTVKFCDGSVVDIQGRGMVIFACSNDKHRTLTDIYYIPCLRSNIVSLGRLDESGYHISIRNGFLKLHDHRQRLLSRVPRARNRMHVVTLDIVKPVCLAAMHNNDS
jgi:hypothetical protein